MNAFEESCCFFTIYATLDGLENEPDCSLTTLYPSLDMNRMVEPGPGEESAIVMVHNLETVRGRPVRTLTAFEPACPADFAPWHGSCTGERPCDYQSYKHERVARMVARIERALPRYRGRVRVLDSATALTYRDWLNTPGGAAYGIKQKIGQLNLAGRLPVANLFAAGQSALLPGVVGAMLASFIVCREFMGVRPEPFQEAVCS